MIKTMRSLHNLANSPFLWGVLGSIGFYALVHAGPVGVPIVKRYFTSHPVEYMLTVMFAVALSALVIKAFDIIAQRAGLGERLLGPAPSGPQSIDTCRALLARLDNLPARRQKEYRTCRLRAALEHIANRGSTDALDDELKYLADNDAGRLHGGYGLFRVIVWAIPILGFLGTVIGITMALNGVDLQSPDQSMFAVLNGLGLKFDTTALALTLSMVLMFVHFYVERAEQSLLEAVDQRVKEELSGRFAQATPGCGDAQLVALRRISETMIQAIEGLMRRQAELWQTSVEAAARSWATMADGAAREVREAMSAAAGELAQRAAVLQRAVDAAAEIASLEHALNRNLATLAGAKHFEQTALSLAAAVNMLSAQLTGSTESVSRIKLEPIRTTAHAA